MPARSGRRRAPRTRPARRGRGEKFGTVTSSITRVAEARRIAVVAPHPDDDAIGCGGTLARAAASGARVRVIYVTDGSASHPRSKRFPPPALRAQREVEARRGLRELGIREAPAFMRVPDGTAAQLDPSARARLVRALAATLETSGCDLVFGPWTRDPHPDHAASAALLEEALARLACRPAHMMYAVWLDEFGTAADRPPPELPVVDVALEPWERARKRAAILAHASQATDLIADDPEGFRITPRLLERWTGPAERFFVGNAPQAGTNAG